MSALSKGTCKDNLGRPLRERRVPAGWVHDEICACGAEAGAHVHHFMAKCPVCEHSALVTGGQPAVVAAHDYFSIRWPAPSRGHCRGTGAIVLPTLQVAIIFGASA